MERKHNYNACSMNIASTSQHSILGNMSENSTPTILYQRRKHLRYSDTVLPFQISMKANPTSNALSVISSEVPTLAANKVEEVHTEAARNPVILPLKSTRELASNGCSLNEELGLVEDSKCDMHRNVDICFVNESCSSSISNTDLCAASIKTEGDDTGECSSSEAFIKKSLCDDLCEKDIRVLIFRKVGLYKRVCRVRSSFSPEVSDSSSECASLRPCKVCDQSELTLKMLICDQCEEAFHISCCYPRLRKLPLNEWFCHSCSKKKHKIPKELTARGPMSSSSEMGRGSKGALGTIAAMLEDTEPYTTSVRIGLEFQAEVPDWSGPLTNEVDNFGEPLELSLSYSFQKGNSRKTSKFSSICNWIQCQNIICGVGDGVDGTVCGKWRRAPLFEVQNDDWECFRSVLWDPAHADCAVPQKPFCCPFQEVDTDQVLKDLKYIEMLKPRIAAKKRKSG